jgi:hypothetical protein
MIRVVRWRSRLLDVATTPSARDGIVATTCGIVPTPYQRLLGQ